MRRVERLRALGVERLGFVPAFLLAPRQDDEVMAGLWEQTLRVWADGPVPALFREKLSAYLARYCPHPYCIVCHSCGLRQMGMRAAQVLDVLTQPLPTDRECQTHMQMLSRMVSREWPESGSAGESALFRLGVAVFMRMDASGDFHRAIRAALEPALAGHFWMLLSYIRTVHEWVEAHPEISYGEDERARGHLQSLLAEEPALAAIFEGCDATSRSARKDYEQRLVNDLAQRERAVHTIDGKALRLRSTMLHAPFPVMIYAEDGQVVQVNDVWTELSGYAPHEIATVADWCRRAQPGTSPHTAEDIDALYESDQRVEEGEQTVRTRYGTELTWDFSSVPLGLLADGRRAVLRMAADVTEHRQLEKSLWNTKERMLEILESITDGFFALDGESQFVYVNERAEQLLDRSREDLIGRNCWDVLPNATEAGFRADVERAVREGRTIHSEKLLPSGRWFEWHIYPSREGLSIHFSEITERVKMAEALREANQRLEALIHASPLAVVVLDKAGLVRRWSPAAERIFGWSEQQVVGRPLPMVNAAQAADISRIMAGAMAHGEPVSYEGQRVTRDGRSIDVQVWAAPLYDAAGRGDGTMGMVADITARRRSEAALRQSEHRYRALLSTIPDLMFQVGRDGTLVDCVDSAERQLPAPAAEVVGRTVGEVLPADVSGRFLDAVGRALAEGRLQAVEYAMMVDGTRRHYEARIAPYSQDDVLAIVRDISASKGAQEALHEANEALTALVQASPLSIVVIDLNGSVRLWNPASQRLFGWTEQEVLGRPLPVIPAERLEEFRTNRKRLLQGETMGNALLPCLRKDGSQVLVYLSIAPVHDSAGKPRSLLGIMSEHTGAQPLRW